MDEAIDTGIDQDAMAADFELVADEVDQGGNPVPLNPGQPENGESKEQPDTKPKEEKGAPAQTEDGQQPAKPDGADEVLNDYRTEDGAVDFQKFIDNFRFDKEVQTPARIDSRPDVSQILKDTTPQVDPIKQETEYRTNVRNNLFSGISAIEQLIQQGYDVNAAIAYAKNKLNDNYNEFIMQRDIEQRAELEKRLTGESEQKLSAAQEQALAQRNEASVIAKAGGSAKYERLMFNPQLGGGFVQMLHSIMVPDSKTMDNNAYAQSFNSWYNKVASDANALNWMFEHAKAWAKHRNEDKLYREFRKKAAGAAEKENKAQGVKPRPTGPVSQPKQDSFDAWLNSGPGGPDKIE